MRKLGYAFTRHETGPIEYMGPIVRQTDKTITINCFNALTMCLLGIPEESGQLKTFPRDRCYIFATLEDMRPVAESIAFQQREKPCTT
jgi:hypothetical protein